jgi:nitrate reductase delta subunit
MGENISFTILAEAFCYPDPGQLEALKAGLANMPPGVERKAFARFLQKISRLTLGEWEELHTRTLDLNPPAAPYIGFQTWGESYQRGQFLANLNRAVLDAGVDPDGELPDHLTPVLRYLGAVENPLPELVEALPAAVQWMISALRKVEPENPYVDLLEAVHEVCGSLKKEVS